MKLCILVTHLLGTGHLRRAAILARAAVEGGCDVVILSGGSRIDGLDTGGARLVQLPPLRSNGTDFSTLLDAEGLVASEAYMARRTDMITRDIAHFAPDVLLTELYPFGRRILAAEFLAAIDAARGLPRPAAVVSSIRDILAPPSKPKRVPQTDAVLANSYDAVLVHSDPDIIPLSASWPVSDFLNGLLQYTGFVAPPVPDATANGEGQGEILVSAGGGNVGQSLFEAACEAARLLPDYRFRLLAGAPDTRALLAGIAPDNVIIEDLRSDFRSMLTRAACSLSMCGYNTAMDALQTGVPALFVPFDEGGEVEQSLRAQALGRLPAIQVAKASELEPAALASALKALCTSQRRTVAPDSFDGAHHSIAFLQEIANARAA